MKRGDGSRFCVRPSKQQMGVNDDYYGEAARLKRQSGSASVETLADLTRPVAGRPGPHRHAYAEIVGSNK
jgi:hypothetical protein